MNSKHPYNISLVLSHFIDFVYDDTTTLFAVSTRSWRLNLFESSVCNVRIKCAFLGSLIGISLLFFCVGISHTVYQSYFTDLNLCRSSLPECKVFSNYPILTSNRSALAVMYGLLPCPRFSKPKHPYNPALPTNQRGGDLQETDYALDTFK